MACTNHPDVITGLDRCSRCGKDFCPDCMITLQGALVCSGCKSEKVLDIRSGTGAKLELAGAGARLGGAILDSIIVYVPIFGGIFALTFANASGSGEDAMKTVFTGIGMIAVVVLVPGIYEGAMLAARGQTVGKMAIKAKVVNADGTPLTGWQPWVRAFSRTIMGAIPSGLLSLVDALMIFSKDRATLHDRIARTRVVRVN
jgi:uncharacterized RDD family membrane protein YckC